MSKKKFVFIAPAALAGAAIAGVVTAAAGTVGRKVVEDNWKKEEEKDLVKKSSEHVYQIDVGGMTKHELVLALREIQEAWEDAHPKRKEPPHSPFYPKDV